MASKNGKERSTTHESISWELSWKKVVFVPPFLFGLDENLVEVRNVCTGALVQIIKIEESVPPSSGVDDSGARARRALVQTLKTERELCYGPFSSSPEIRDDRADFYREWDEDDSSENVLSDDKGFQLSKWGPMLVTSSRIVQLVPRFHPEFLDSRLFDVELVA